MQNGRDDAGRGIVRVALLRTVIRVEARWELCVLLRVRKNSTFEFECILQRGIVGKNRSSLPEGARDLIMKGLHEIGKHRAVAGLQKCFHRHARNEFDGA